MNVSVFATQAAVKRLYVHMCITINIYQRIYRKTYLSVHFIICAYLIIMTFIRNTCKTHVRNCHKVCIDVILYISRYIIHRYLILVNNKFSNKLILRENNFAP